MSSKANKNKETPHIEENMLITWFESKFGFLKPHYKMIAVVTGLLVVAGILGAVLLKASNENYAAQWNLLNLAVTEFANDQKTDHLTEMASQNPNTAAGLWALQIAGDQELNMGLVKMTNPARFPADDNEDLRSTAIRHVKKAKETFKQILDSKGKRSPLLEQRTVYSLARASESLGEWDDAKKYYTMLIESAPDSEFVDNAKRGVARTSDEKMMAFYDSFSSTKIGMAPGVSLPEGDEPNIDFPDVDLPDLNTEEENTPDSTDSETGTEDKTSDDDAEGTKEDGKQGKAEDQSTEESKGESNEKEATSEGKDEKTDDGKKEESTEGEKASTEDATKDKKEESKSESEEDDKDDEQLFSFYLGMTR